MRKVKSQDAKHLQKIFWWQDAHKRTWVCGFTFCSRNFFWSELFMTSWQNSWGCVKVGNETFWSFWWYAKLNKSWMFLRSILLYSKLSWERRRQKKNFRKALYSTTTRASKKYLHPKMHSFCTTLCSKSLQIQTFGTVFENHRKSLIQHWCILVSFWKPEACGQTVLPDRSVLIGQKLVENAKIQMRHFE